MSPKVEFSNRDKFDLKEQQKKTIQMLQNYSKEQGDKGNNKEGILFQDSLVNSKETLTYRPGGGGGLVSKNFNTITGEERIYPFEPEI